MKTYTLKLTENLIRGIDASTNEILDAPEILHHVMIRGIKGTKIFHDDQDRENFLFRIGPLVEKTGATVFAWILMGNPVHLLISSGHQGISKFMR